MEDVRDSMTSSERGPVSPIKAFLVLGAVAAATIGIIIATRPDPPAATQQPNSASIPTEAEAIEIFNDLHELRIRSYEQLDTTLLRHVFAPGSRIEQSTQEELRQLRRDQVTPLMLHDRRHLTVASLGTDKIVLEETALVEIRFLDQNEEDISGGVAPQEQRIRWTLSHVGNGWRISGGIILASKESGE
jgi:hypothetical protein